MFAVLKTGGKQYKVASGDILRVEKIIGNTGDMVQFNDILLIGGDKPAVGAPLVADAAVQAQILEQGKGSKVINFVKRRRKHGSQRKLGHRQQITVLRVDKILAKGASKSGVAIVQNGAGFTPVAVSSTEPMKKTASKAHKPAAKKAATKRQTTPQADKAVTKKAPTAKTADSKPAARKAATKRQTTPQADKAVTKKAPTAKTADSKPAARKAATKRQTTPKADKSAIKKATTTKKPAAKPAKKP